MLSILNECLLHIWKKKKAVKHTKGFYIVIHRTQKSRVTLLAAPLKHLGTNNIISGQDVSLFPEKIPVSLNADSHVNFYKNRSSVCNCWLQYQCISQTKSLTTESSHLSGVF